MKLLSVELSRFRSRRAVVIILIVAAGLAGLLVASAAYDSRPISSSEQSDAAQRAAQQRADVQPDYQSCRADPTAYFDDDTATKSDCAQILPQADWFLDRSALDLGNELKGRGLTLLVLLAGTAILVGATFAGADWSSGSMSHQLMFVPRRGRVWTAKAAAVVIGTTVLSALVVVAFWAVLYGVSASRGLHTPAAVWGNIAETSGRGIALAAAVALGSFAVTMLLRHTGATLGLLFAYAVVGEGLVASLPFDKMTQWSLPYNVAAWLQDGRQVYDDSLPCGSTPGCSSTYVLPLSHAAIYLGVLLVLAVVVSIVTFRRRDLP
jgi:hypothetical protein